MSTTTPNPPSSTPTPAPLQSLDQRISALSIRIATDRADAREKIPKKHGVWVRDNDCTTELDQIQIAMEKDWIRLRDASAEVKAAFVESLEQEYAELIAEWKAEGKM